MQASGSVWDRRRGRDCAECTPRQNEPRARHLLRLQQLQAVPGAEEELPQSGQGPIRGPLRLEPVVGVCPRGPRPERRCPERHCGPRERSRGQQGWGWGVGWGR